MSEQATVHFTAVVTQEGEWYVARCLEVEVASKGHTVEESLASLREALELYFEDAPPVEAAHPIRQAGLTSEEFRGLL
ncbi:MAG TPA: type II toxin-antitoxin system HicB family antitoxin [Actinomycetota bacterium]